MIIQRDLIEHPKSSRDQFFQQKLISYSHHIATIVNVLVMNKLEGKIVSSTPLRNNAWHYMVQARSGQIQKYTYFGKEEMGLDTSRSISFSYKTSHNNYGTSHIIDQKTISYGDVITDPKCISEFLVKQLRVSRGDALTMISLYGNQTLTTIFKDPKTISKFPSSKKYKDNIRNYKENHANTVFEIEMTSLGISTQYHEKMIKAFKDISHVKEKIYHAYFSAKVPFTKCDEIGMSLKYDRNDPNRIDAFLDDFFEKKNQMGSLYVHKEAVCNGCRSVRIDSGLALPKLILLEENGEPYYTAPKFHDMEMFIEEFCNRVIERDGFIKHKVPALDHQLIAVGNTLRFNISLVTGGPGRGKSYTIGTIIEKLHTHNKIYVLAPTGAAVERLRCEDRINLLDEAIEIKTIHSFIFTNVENKNADEKRDLPKYANEQKTETLVDLYHLYQEFVIFVDEASMVDLELLTEFFRLMDTISDKVRVILLGDVDQLPSIRGGNILYDLIHSGSIPYVRLNKNHRTDNSEINDNAQLALRGEPLEPRGNFIWIEANDRDEIQKELLKAIEIHKISFDNSCVLVPNRKSGICVNSLNPILQNYYNPSPKPTKEFFRAGDKVIQGTNNREKDVYNGSIMMVDDVDYSQQPTFLRLDKMKCRYYRNECVLNKGEDYREITYKRDQNTPLSNHNTVEYNKIDLAYAMTVHKAQGKGYDTVVIVMHSSMRYLLNRNMLYTAITRAKNKCIIISDERALFECQKEADKRVTNLYNKRKQLAPAYEDFRSIEEKVPRLEGCYLDGIDIDVKAIGERDHLEHDSNVSKLHNELLENDDLFNLLKYAE